MDDNTVKIATGVIVAVVSATAYLVGRITTSTANQKALTARIENNEARIDTHDGRLRELELVNERRIGREEGMKEGANTGPHPTFKR